MPIVMNEMNAMNEREEQESRGMKAVGMEKKLNCLYRVSRRHSHGNKLERKHEYKVSVGR